MADQDYDGSHIKGLLINFFHYFWPDLLLGTKLCLPVAFAALLLPRLKGNKGFLQQFVTPIVKATKDGQVHQFFTMVEYEKWKAKTKDGAGWKIKYYKGLGTSTAAEAKEYFGNIHHHRIDFKSSPKLLLAILNESYSMRPCYVAGGGTALARTS